MLSEFVGINAEDSAFFDAWFGREAKSNRRTVKRLLDDLDKQVNSTDQLAEYDVLMKQKKSK